MKNVLFFQLLICVINIAFGLFSLDQTLNEFNSTMGHSIISIFCILSLALIYFYYGDRVTADLFKIGDIFYNSLWYKIPAQKQKLLIFPIRRAQQEFRLKGFEIFICSLEYFGAVCSMLLILIVIEFSILKQFQ